MSHLVIFDGDLVDASLKQHYQDEAVARSYDRERFTSFAGKTLDYLEKRALGRALRRIRVKLPQPTLLDLPCGTGRITEFWLERGLETVGGDVSLPMMEVARGRCARFGTRASFRCLDLERLDLADGSFDVVTCVRLFHHLESAEREGILRALARVARHHVLVNVSYASPYYRWRRRVKRWLRQGVSKASSTWPEIQREASASGLSVEACYFVCPFLSEDLVVLMRK